MLRRVDLNRRPDLHVVADRDPVAVQKDAVIVHKHISTNQDIVAVVATEGRLQDRAAAEMTEELHEKRQPLFGSISSRRIELIEEILRVKMVGDELRICGAIKLAGEHFLLFACHP